MTCRVNCTCKVCGRVHLHVTKRVRRAKPKPVDPAVAELAAAMTGMVARSASKEPDHA